MENQKISVDLREGNSKDNQNRRKIAFLSALGIVDFTIISLYQIGGIRKLPDVPLNFINSEKVISSDSASILGMPDAPIALNMYIVNMLLASSAINKKKPSRWLDLLLGSIVAGNAAGAAYFMLNMTLIQKKACLYCITGALVNFMTIKPMLALLRK